VVGPGRQVDADLASLVGSSSGQKVQFRTPALGFCSLVVPEVPKRLSGAGCQSPYGKDQSEWGAVGGRLGGCFVEPRTASWIMGSGFAHTSTCGQRRANGHSAIASTGLTTSRVSRRSTRRTDWFCNRAARHRKSGDTCAVPQPIHPVLEGEGQVHRLMLVTWPGPDALEGCGP